MDDESEIAAGAAGLAARFIAETNAFLGRHYSNPDVGWPRKPPSNETPLAVDGDRFEDEAALQEITTVWAESGVSLGLQTNVHAPLLQHQPNGPSGASPILVLVRMVELPPPSETSRARSLVTASA